MKRALLLTISLTLPALAQAPNPAQERADYIRSHYAKFEARIPMRDGTRLFTSIYVPNDVAFGKRYPLLMQRTPYTVAPYGLDVYKTQLGPNLDYEKDGFIFVFQDVRGCWMSEGNFVNMRPRNVGGVDETSDSYDTIDWLVKNVDGNNGNVGIYGVSYPGFYSACAAIESHPALKAVSPQAPIADWWKGDDMHRNGAFNLQMTFGFFANFARPRPVPKEVFDKPFEYPTSDAYRYFLELGPLSNAASRFGFDNQVWKDICQHPNYDSFWQQRNLLPHLKGVKAATMVVAGWFDAEDLYGPLNIYQHIKKLNPTSKTHLVVGPWVHGGWWRTDNKTLGDADFGFSSSKLYQQLELAFFKQHLKGGESAQLPGAWAFETGANRWRSFTSWPPPQGKAHRYHLAANQKLQHAPSRGHSEFVSDPQKPVPYTADRRSIRASKDYMAEDQRYASSRPDVLSFEGELLQEDLTLAGPVDVDLWVSTSAQDADWIVKIIDVNPGQLPSKAEGYRGHQETLVRGEPMRGRFRDDPSRPKPFEPGTPTRVRFRLNDIFHTFQRNHRLMVQVQSSWFPYIDRNPQKWVDNIFNARPQDFVKATHRVYHDPEHPSHIEVRLLPNPMVPTSPSPSPEAN